MHDIAAPRNRFILTIADISIQVSSPLTADELGIMDRLGPFLGAAENPDARLSLRWEESKSTPFHPDELIYDPGSIWKMYRAGEEFYAALTYADRGGSAPALSVLQANAAWDDLTLTERRTGSGWRSLLNLGAGELVLRTSILFSDGLMFHAAGVDDNGRGLVFLGHSGAGKSTQASLWSTVPGAIAMSDDRIAVRANAVGAVCYGTPWGGTASIARNHRAALSAIIVLEQAPRNEIRALSSTSASSLLLARAFLPYWDEILMERALSNINSILTSAPIFLLRCRPETAAIDLVRSVI